MTGEPQNETPRHMRLYGLLTFVCIAGMLSVPLFIFASEAPDGVYLLALVFFFICLGGTVFFSESIKDWALTAQNKIEKEREEK